MLFGGSVRASTFRTFTYPSVRLPELSFTPTDPAEILPIFIFAGISSFILLLLLCYCIYVRIPSRHLTLWKKEAEDRHAPSMFESINQEQVDAAKRALEKNIKQSPTNQRVRVFNLDIAKLWYDLAARC